MPPLTRLALPLLLLAAPLGGCVLPEFASFPTQVRGNKVDADQLKELTPGTTSRADVTSLLGSPTSRATFDDNTWIYVTETTKPIIGGTEYIEDQKVVVLTFDQNGTLKSVEQRGKNDSMPVDVVARTTPSPGTNATVLQQLLGNVGKFNPVAGAAGGPGGGGGGGGATFGQ